MTTKALLALGQFQFEVGRTAYSQLVRTYSYHWVAQERIGRYPALKFMGIEAERIELSGEVYSSRVKSADPLEPLKESAKLGTPSILVDGEGNELGKWVVTAVEETHDSIKISGQARKISFRISLLRNHDEIPQSPGISSIPGRTGPR